MKKFLLVLLPVLVALAAHCHRQGALVLPAQLVGPAEELWQQLQVHLPLQVLRGPALERQRDSSAQGAGSTAATAPEVGACHAAQCQDGVDHRLKAFGAAQGPASHAHRLAVAWPSRSHHCMQTKQLCFMASPCYPCLKRDVSQTHSVDFRNCTCTLRSPRYKCWRTLLMRVSARSLAKLTTSATAHTRQYTA